jgi:hypothetical protein
LGAGPINNRALGKWAPHAQKANPSGPPPIRPLLATMTATVEEETVTVESKPGVGLILMMIQQQMPKGEAPAKE